MYLNMMIKQTQYIFALPNNAIAMRLTSESLYKTLQDTATHCKTLQDTATHCKTLTNSYIVTLFVRDKGKEKHSRHSPTFKIPYVIYLDLNIVIKHMQYNFTQLPCHAVCQRQTP